MDGARKELSLNGDWILVPDPARQGVVDGWTKGLPDKPQHAVKVPAVWDRWIPDERGIGWYFKTFTVTPDWALPHAEIHFEAANYAVQVWLNGARIGEHEGGSTPFSLPTGTHLRAGDNFLAVRLNNPYGPKGCEDFRPGEIPCGAPGDGGHRAGIWGGVSLRTRGTDHIEDVFIQPDVRRKRIAVNVRTHGEGALVFDVDGLDAYLEAESGEDVYHLELPEFTPWSLESPQCHTLNVSLRTSDGVVDSVSIRFGMRDFTIKENRFYLNNHPIFIKGVIVGQNYAHTIATPHDPAMLRRELELIKDAGFNMIRLQAGVALPQMLDLADELGLLVFAGTPVGHIRETFAMAARCEQAVREVILRDRNHPSVVLWNILENTDGTEAGGPGDARKLRDGLCDLARSLDPTRVIIDITGDAALTRTPAQYIRPYRTEREVFEDIQIRLQAPVDLDAENYLRHCGQPDMLCFVSSFGLGGPEDLAESLAAYDTVSGDSPDKAIVEALARESERGFDQQDLAGIFGTPSGFQKAARMIQCDAAKAQIDALRANPNLAGYCYRRWADEGRDFSAGLVDRWRRPKPVLGMLKHIQAAVRPLIQAEKTNLMPREEVNVTILLANEARLEGQAELSLQVVGPTDQVLWKKKRAVRLPKHGRELWTGSVAASGSTGTHRFVVRVLLRSRVVAQSSIDLHVFKEIEPATNGINLLDPHGVWTARCKTLARLKPVTAPVHIVPPLGNTIRAYPENELIQLLAQVREGAVAVVFGPPDDWNDLTGEIEGLPRATSRDAYNAPAPVLHYTKLHPVLEGLPARGFMRQPYRNVLAPKTFAEHGDEVFCGTWDSRALIHPINDEDATPWGTDILVQKYGTGRIIFTHLRVLEHLGEDPAADRLFVNLVQHLTRRSVPPEHPVPLDRQAVEWLRSERVAHAHRWMILGEFPSPDGKGHELVYPPEEAVDLQARYPGWYQLIGWRPRYSLSKDEHWLDLQAACMPVFQPGLRNDHSVAYAYAEFVCEKRQEVDAVLRMCNDTKVWLNGKLLHEGRHQRAGGEVVHVEAPAIIRQGRNTVLVKCTRIPGRFGFSFDVQSQGRVPLQMKWSK